MTREKALRQAAKLLKLASSDNANEAAAAAAQAQAILDKYELNEAMLSLDEDDEVDEVDEEEIVDFGERGAPLHEAKRLATWRDRLCVNVCKVNAVMPYHVGGALHVIGRPSDVMKVRYLFAWLCREVDRLTERDGKGCGRTWCNQFRLGVVDTLSEALKRSMSEVAEDARRQAQGNSKALMRIDQALAKVEKRGLAVDVWVKQHKQLRAGRANYARANPGARKAGQRAGKEIDLGGGRRRQLSS